MIRTLTFFLSLLIFSPNFAHSETDVNLYLFCNENLLSPESQKIWDNRKIIVEEAVSYKNIFDNRIEELNRSSEIARINGQLEAMQQYRNESFKLQEKSIREISKYKIQISKLNNTLRFGNDADCFRTGIKLGVLIQDQQNTNAISVIVQQVSNGSLGQRMGIKEGDVILAINSLDLKNGGELVSKLRSMNTGDMIDLKISRNGLVLFLNSLGK